MSRSALLGSRSLGFRGSVFVATFAVAVSLVTVTGSTVSAAPEQPDAASEAESGALQRPDAVSAMTTARVSGEPVEDLSQRTEAVLVFAQPDGSWTQEVATGPVRVEDPESGEWSDIDTTLAPSPDGESFVPKAALGGLVVSGGGEGSFASMEVEGRPLEWQWPTELPEPVIEGSTATYPDVLADGLSGDLVVTAMPGGFRHDIVLNEAPTIAGDPAEAGEVTSGSDAAAELESDGGPVFEIPIVTGRGPQLELDEAQGEGALAVTTKAGEELVTASAPVMFDASRDTAGNPTEVLPVAAELSSGRTGGVLELAPDAAWLMDPATQYPVTIDPVVTSYNSNDTWIGSGGNRHPHDPTLHVGTDNGGANKYRTFLQFPQAAWSGARINSATLLMRNSAALTCSGSAVQVQRVVSTYDNGQIVWPGPTTTSTGAVNSSEAFGRSGCATDDMTWNVTSIVQTWAHDAATNRGMRVAAINESVNSSYRQFRSDNYDHPLVAPRLVVNYNNVPTAPSSLTIDGESEDVEAVYASSPAISALMEDADGDRLAGTFELTDTGAPSVPVWTTTVSQTLANTHLYARVPEGTLIRGKRYRLNARSRDPQGLASPITSLEFTYVNVADVSQSPVSEEATDAINIFGAIARDGSPLGDGSALVELWPNSKYLETLPDDAEVPLWRIGNFETDTQGRFQATFNPEDVPEAFESDQGSFDIEIDVTDGSRAMTYDVVANGAPSPPTSGSMSSNLAMAQTSASSDETLEVSMDLGTGAAEDEDNPTLTWDVNDEAVESDPNGPAVGFSVAPPGGRDEQNVAEETAERTEHREMTTAEANARALALLGDSEAGSAESRMFAATQQQMVPAAGGCVTKKLGESKVGQLERFGSVYNWSGAKVDWTQSTSTEHRLGVAVSAGGNWRSSGSATIGRSRNQSFSTTAYGIVNKNAYNKVNYRKYRTECGLGAVSLRWRPESFNAFFTNFTPSVKKSWSSSCVIYNNIDIVKDSGRSYTKSTGVNLAGIAELSAQSGYNRGTRMTFKIRKRSQVCASTPTGIATAPGIRALKY